MIIQQMQDNIQAAKAVDRELIVLSFAPSAAAVWHCDRVRIPCESNSARHSFFIAFFIAIFATHGSVPKNSQAIML